MKITNLIQYSDKWRVRQDFFKIKVMQFWIVEKFYHLQLLALNILKLQLMEGLNEFKMELV